MTSLLDNESVRKYFYDLKSGCGASAERVLDAMQQPIRKGDRMIVISQVGDIIWEMVATGEEVMQALHPQYLRLPDEFQKQGCQLPEYGMSCPSCGKVFTHPCPGSFKPIPSPECCRRQAHQGSCKLVFVPGLPSHDVS